MSPNTMVINIKIWGDPLLQKSLFVFLFLSAPFSFAQVHNPVAIERFDQPLFFLQRTLKSEATKNLTQEQVTRKLLRGPHRWAAFNLQSLAQIYQKYPTPGAKDFFKRGVRFEAKSLEDSIGTYQKWRDIHKFLIESEASPAKVAHAKLEQDVAFDLLTYVVTGLKRESLSGLHTSKEIEKLVQKFEDGKQKSPFKDLYWAQSAGGLADHLRKAIEAYPFLPYSQDRSFFLKRISKHLIDLKDTQFSFEYLEDTPEFKGLHEFRREVRWATYNIKNSNGTIQYSDASPRSTKHCPVDELLPLLSDKSLQDSQYTRLNKTRFPQIENPTCKISRCLFYKLSDVVARVGDVKDEVELINELDDLNNKTPNQAAFQVSEIHRSLLRTKTLEHLSQQILKCEALND